MSVFLNDSPHLRLRSAGLPYGVLPQDLALRNQRTALRRRPLQIIRIERVLGFVHACKDRHFRLC
jgi:hypothetical protein